MSRDGFAHADIDTGLMSDPKVLALARLLRDSARTGAALALWQSVLLASWKDGDRLTLDEALPGWWLDPHDDLADALVSVRLLDDERRIPLHAWDDWYGPAEARRQYYRDLGARGGRAKALAHALPDGLPSGLAHALPRQADRQTDRSAAERAGAERPPALPPMDPRTSASRSRSSGPTARMASGRTRHRLTRRPTSKD